MSNYNKFDDNVEKKINEKKKFDDENIIYNEQIMREILFAFTILQLKSMCCDRRINIKMTTKAKIIEKLLKVKMKIKKFIVREKIRNDLKANSNLIQFSFIFDFKILVILIDRTLNNSEFESRKIDSLLSQINAIFRNQKISNCSTSIEYMHVKLRETNFIKEISIRNNNVTSRIHSWMLTIKNLSRENRIVILNLKINDFSKNVLDWKCFLKHWKKLRDLKITMLFCEVVTQWRQVKNILTRQNWIDFVLRRYWFNCDLAVLLRNDINDSIRIYRQIFEQWEKNMKNRISQKMKKTDRNRKKRLTETKSKQKKQRTNK